MHKAAEIDLSPADVRDFRAAFARRSPLDLDGHCERVEAARRLSGRAWGAGASRSAWETAQVLMYQLQARANLRPTEPGDVHVLSTLYAAAEAHRTVPSLPESLAPRAFCDHLVEVIGPYSVTSTPVEAWLEERTPEDWSYLAYQFFPYAYHFTNIVALASFGLARTDAALVYQNLWDEVGHGANDAFHFNMIAKWAAQFDSPLEPSVALDWVLPEGIADLNTQLRILWRDGPAGALASMYLFERLDRVGYEAILRSMERNRVPEREYFDTHLVVDDAHAAAWLASLERVATDAASQREALAAVVERAEGLRAVLDACVSGLGRWKESRQPPRLPFRELSAQSADRL